MKNGLVSLVLLAAFLASGSTLGQHNWEIVIEPAIPDSRDRITISVPDSACFVSSEVREDLEDRFIGITLTYFLQYLEQCQNDAPESPDFATTIGPLKPGEYSMILWTNWGGFGHPIVAERSIVVTEAPPAEALLDGGINGFYYNPDADGHYVYILETDFTTLLTWNTFDADGNQAWIFGTGKLENGKAVVANAYVNHSDGYSTDGRLEGLEVVHWGTLEVEMQSCWDGTVTYQSELPGFGSGQFPIRRLAFAKQIGCDEAD
jgi:hypothetical protein